MIVNESQKYWRPHAIQKVNWMQWSHTEDGWKHRDLVLVLPASTATPCLGPISVGVEYKVAAGSACHLARDAL